MRRDKTRPTVFDLPDGTHIWAASIRRFERALQYETKPVDRFSVRNHFCTLRMLEKGFFERQAPEAVCLKEACVSFLMLGIEKIPRELWLFEWYKFRFGCFRRCCRFGRSFTAPS
jgi:hypothetical protein